MGIIHIHYYIQKYAVWRTLNSCKIQQKSSGYSAAHLILITAQFEMLPFPPLASISLLFKVTLTSPKGFFDYCTVIWQLCDIVPFFSCLVSFVYSTGFLGISNENAFFQKLQCTWNKLHFQGYQTTITPDTLPPLCQHEANINLNFSFINWFFFVVLGVLW